MKLSLALAAILALGIPLYGRQYQHGKIIYWIVLPHGGHDARGSLIYRLETIDGVLEIVQDTKHPEAHLAVGQQMQFRIDKNHLFKRDGKGKEVHFFILKPAVGQPIYPGPEPHFELICASNPLLS